MNLNDPEMQKQLKRWDTIADAAWQSFDVCHGGVHVMKSGIGACQCGAIRAGGALLFAPTEAEYDAAYLKDLGISQD